METKRFASFLLALCLAAGLLSGTALAASDAVASGMDNFHRDGSYQAGTFNDVSVDAWYAEGVSAAYELGLMKGSSTDAFSPTGNVTVAEAVTMASRLHRRYSGGEDDFLQGTPWYQVYVDYALANGILSSDDFSGGYEANITRGQMAHLFAAALPEKELPKISEVSSIPDVDSSTPYNEDIFLLYWAGVLAGNDEKGTFTPDNPILRSEVATIIARMALPSMRKVRLYTSGTPIGESKALETTVVNRLTEGSFTVHSCTVQPLDNGYVRYTLDYTGPKGLTVSILDRATNGNLFSLRDDSGTPGGQSALVFDILAERATETKEIAIRFLTDEYLANPSENGFCGVVLPGYQEDID